MKKRLSALHQDKDPLALYRSPQLLPRTKAEYRISVNKRDIVTSEVLLSKHPPLSVGRDSRSTAGKSTEVVFAGRTNPE
jgi:hypothetical protein